MQTFFRTTTRPVEVLGVKLGEGEKVLLFLAAANRDARRWENPDRFDATRLATGHLAVGVSIHGCVGMAVARLEAEIVLSLLARKVETIELSGEPERRLNNTLRGPRPLADQGPAGLTTRGGLVSIRGVRVPERGYEIVGGLSRTSPPSVLPSFSLPRRSPSTRSPPKFPASPGSPGPSPLRRKIRAALRRI